MSTAGQHLRAIREQLGPTMRDVEAASVRIAARHSNEDFTVPLSRLSDIEAKGVLPNIHPALFSLGDLPPRYPRDDGLVRWRNACCRAEEKAKTGLRPRRWLLIARTSPKGITLLSFFARARLGGYPHGVSGASASGAARGSGARSGVARRARGAERRGELVGRRGAGVASHARPG